MVSGDARVPALGMSPEFRVRMRLMLELGHLEGERLDGRKTTMAAARAWQQLLEEAQRGGMPDEMTDAAKTLIAEAVVVQLEALGRIGEYQQRKDGKDA